MSLAYNQDEPQYPQTADWTCSACALAWLNRALGIDHATDEWSAVDYIGNPENINSTYGLMDGSGAVLASRLREQGAPALTAWPSWEETRNLAWNMPLLIGGVNWYHWVGVRCSLEDGLFLANSAEGYSGVYETLEEDQWIALGPFAVVAVPLLTSFRPTPA